MTDENNRNERRTVRKDLDDFDRTHGHPTGHYTRAELAELCHATGGQDHE